jgi:hypothetical protein
MNKGVTEKALDMANSTICQLVNLKGKVTACNNVGAFDV